jgi:bleomycin hydrolase
MLKYASALLAVTLCALPWPATGQTPSPRDSVVYEAETRDPALKEIKERNEAEDAGSATVTAAIRKQQEANAKAKKDSKKVLRASLPEALLPGPPSTFEQVYHVEPQAQFYTGTCWAYAATSFLESEIFRTAGEKVKMSEMHTVYWEYVEKTRRYVRQRGDSHFSEGSEHNAVTRIWSLYGAVPLEAYAGVLKDDGRHDHIRLSKELTEFLAFVKAKNRWDEEWVIVAVRTILDRHLGPPPTEFKYNGKKYTPRSFLKKVARIEPDDYVGFMSTMAHPFYAPAEFEVPDNWWHDGSYNNVPLDRFVAGIDGAIRAGHSVAIGGDVSEPGKNFRQDIAFVPTFDIPGDHIDQSAREYRINNGTTGDDHGIHLVGVRDVGERTWYLIKDSGRSARHGKFDGYYFFRDDFVKLKMLTFMVHKDAVKELLGEIKQPEEKKDKEK